MKRTLTFLTTLLLVLPAFCQDSMEKIMEKRAKEMHRVIGLTDKEEWKRFIKENYTQTLIDRPMQAKVQTSDNGSTSTATAETKSADNVEAKAGMFQRLHNDFGNSKLISLKPNAEKMEMILKSNSGMTGNFILTFDKKSPYLIDKLGIEVGN